MKSTTRVQAHVQPAAVHVQAAPPAATVHVEAGVQASVPAPPPAVVVTPNVLVPLEGAPVVEFFGIPLEGAQDVVFVLDRSGSMSDPARGRLAQLHVASAPPPTATDPALAPPSPSDAPPPPDAPNGPPPGPDVPGAAPAPAPVMQPPRKIDVAQAELVDALERLPAGTRMNVVFFNSDLEAYAPALVALEETGRVNLIAFVKDTAPTGSTALAPAMRIAFLMNARRIVLLSDGLGNVGGNAGSVLRDAREAMRGGVRIDTIGLGHDQDGELLNTLARESGGLYQAL